jgi:hypothetical protein
MLPTLHSFMNPFEMSVATQRCIALLMHMLPMAHAAPHKSRTSQKRSPLCRMITKTSGVLR